MHEYHTSLKGGNLYLDQFYKKGAVYGHKIIEIKGDRPSQNKRK